MSIRNGPGVDVIVEPKITVSLNYNRLQNKPKINGIELSGNLSPGELNLLSADSSQYEEKSLSTDNSTSFMLVIGEDGETFKTRLNQITTGRLIISNDMSEIEPGNFVIKLLED